MLLGQRIRKLREAKKFTQGDVENLTGLKRCYTSRVENGHTVPSVGTLERYARALEIHLYKFFYEGTEPPKKARVPSADGRKPMWGAKGSERSELRKFAKVLSRMNTRERKLLLAMAQGMAVRNRNGVRKS